MISKRFLSFFCLSLLILTLLAMTGCGAVTPAYPGPETSPVLTQPPQDQPVAVATQLLQGSSGDVQAKSTEVFIEGIQTPSECKREQPILSPPVWDENITDYEPNPEIKKATLEYTNSSNQSFTILLYGLDENVMREYIKDLKLCLEALPSNIIALDSYIKEHPQAEGVDVEYLDGNSEFIDANKEFLNGTVNSSDDPWLKILFENRSNLVNEVTWGDLPDLQEEYIVYFSFDPTINRYQRIDYKSKCRTSARAQIDMTAGAATVTLLRSGNSGYLFNYSTANVVGRDPSASLWDSTYSNYSVYDTYVFGNQDNSQYTIYGDWTVGSNIGGCDY